MESQVPAIAPNKNLPRFLTALIAKPRQAFTQLDQTGRPHFLWAAFAMLIVIWLAAIVTLPVTRREAASITAIPHWLPVAAVLLATVVGILSGLYPAQHAARLEPVVALKYE